MNAAKFVRLMLCPTIAFWAAVGIVLSGCVGKPLTPPQAPPAVEVLIPVPVPCQVASVALSGLPTGSEAVKDDIYRAVQLILADRAVLKADRARLAAANSNPCPKAKP